MASRRELLDSLKPGMHLDKNFFLKIYGYDITRPGFADDVIRRLEILGCSKARDYYTCIVSEYNHKRNQTGYDRDYEDFRALKQIVDKHDIGVLLIHHTRKMKDPSDVFNELSGSTGMLGAQDCAWLISKKDRSDNEATLHITGRDLDNRDLKIEFDKKFFQWRYIGTEEEVEARRRETAYMQSPIRETIIKLVGQGSGHWEGRSEEIKNASKYLSQEIYEDVRNIGKFIREYSDLLQGIDGVNAIPGNTKTRKWKFNDTNATNNIDATNDTNATQMKLRYQG